MNKNNTSRLLRVALLVFCLCRLCTSVAAEPMQVRYWGGIPGRVDYELELLREALTAGGEGPFEISLVSESLGSLRGRQEVARGQLVNVYASGYRVDALLERGDIYAIKHPLLKGLLGYRVMIVRTAELERFSGIASVEDVRRFTLGQGNAWYDNEIYRHNGIAVDDSGRFPLLPGMLAHGRFDALALGVMEAGPVLRASEYGSQLSLVPDLLLYYPHPLVFHVSGQAPELASRLERGMQIIVNKGILETLFQQYFGEIITRFNLGRPRLIVLNHPHRDSTFGLADPVLFRGARSPEHRDDVKTLQ